jgi:hypothetical protein
MEIKIEKRNYYDEKVESFSVITDSPGRAVQMYEDECEDGEYLTWYQA